MSKRPRIHESHASHESPEPRHWCPFPTTGAGAGDREAAATMSAGEPSDSQMRAPERRRIQSVAVGFRLIRALEAASAPMSLTQLAASERLTSISICSL